MAAIRSFRLGRLSAVPAASRPDLLADATMKALAATGLLHEVGVVEIDPDVSDTAAAQREYGLELDTLANCVVVGGKREGIERLGACVVLATTRGCQRSGAAPARRSKGVVPGDGARRRVDRHGVRGSRPSDCPPIGRCSSTGE